MLRIKVPFAALPNLRHLRLDNCELSYCLPDWFKHAQLETLIVSFHRFGSRELEAKDLGKFSRVTGPNLRRLGLDFAIASRFNYDAGLTADAIGAIPDLWPQLEVLELVLTHRNIAYHLDEVSGLLKMHALRQLRLSRKCCDECDRTGKQAWAKFLRALSALEEEDSRKVVIDRGDEWEEEF